MNVLQLHTHHGAMRRRRFSATHIVGAVVLAGSLAATALAGVSNAALRTSVTAHAATVKPDYAFFKGKTIHWLTPGAPGSLQDVVFRAMQPYLAAALGATIVQQIIPGNQIISADELANAPADGLTLGTQGVGAALYNELTNVTPESFSLQKVTYFATSHNPPQMLVSCAGSGITSLEQLINDKQQITYLDFPNAADVLYHTLLAAYGVNVKYLTGYTQPTLESGCIRGDGTVLGVTATILNVVNSLPPGENLIALSAKYGPGTPSHWMNSVATSTTIAAFEAKHPIKNIAARRALTAALGFVRNSPNFTFWGPPGIAAGKTAAIVAAIQKVSAIPAVQTVVLSQNLPTSFLLPKTIPPAIKDQVNHFATLRRYVLGNGL